MECPRCNHDLQKRDIQEKDTSIEVDQCDSCGGIWFDKGELDLLENKIKPALLEIRNIPEHKEQYKALLCPTCDNFQILFKASHPRDKEVIIDYCPECSGVWLDHGELKAIQTDDLFSILSRMCKWVKEKKK